MAYATSRVAVDAVVLSIIDDELKIFLHKREKPPFKNKHELPGGLLQNNETAEQTVERKVNEIVGKGVFLEQFRTFTNPERDPRTRTVSIGFIALVNEKKGEWHSIENLPDMAFDHEEIISVARQWLAEHTDKKMMKKLMPREFPLNNLQRAYELIERVKYDNRNFRKKILSLGYVEETGKLEENVSHRPAKLFRFI